MASEKAYYSYQNSKNGSGEPKLSTHPNALRNIRESKNSLLIIFFISLVLNSYGQDSVVKWQKNYSISMSINFVCNSSDNSYFLIGEGLDTSTKGLVKALIIKLRNDSTIIWQKLYGGSKGGQALRASPTQDKGIIFIGTSSSKDGDVGANSFSSPPIWVVKLDSNGSIQWSKVFGTDHNFDNPTSIITTNDGGYLITASTQGDVKPPKIVNIGPHNEDDWWIIKIDKNGKLEWQKTFGGSGIDIPKSCIQLQDSGYLIGGYTSSNDSNISNNHDSFSNDIWVLKLNKIGKLIWEKTYGGKANEVGGYIVNGIDDGYIISGYSNSNNGDLTYNHGRYDYWIFKINDFGVLQWEKTFGGSKDDRLNHMIRTKDSSYILAGQSFSNNGDITNKFDSGDAWIVKLNKKGNIIWQKNYGTFHRDVAHCISNDNINGYIFIGDNNGRRSIYQTDTDYLFMRNWVVRIYNNNITQIEEQSAFNNTAFTLSPNPTSSHLTLQLGNPFSGTINIYNLTGQIIFTNQYTSTQDININTATFSNGIYLLKMTDKFGMVITKKIVVAH